MIPHRRLLVLLLPLVVLSGCFSQSRSETSTTERITFQAQVPIPTAEGVKLLPVTGTIRRVTSQQEITHAGPDTDAIMQAVSQGLAALIPAAGGVAFPWSQTFGVVGTALTAATTGYLALKKREQLKPPMPKQQA